MTNVEVTTTENTAAVAAQGATVAPEKAASKKGSRQKKGAPKGQKPPRVPSPVAYAAKVRAAYDARPAEFHAYIRALVAACDFAHRARLDSLVSRMPEDPDAVWSVFDDAAYDLRIEDVARCCRARRALTEAVCGAASC